VNNPLNYFPELNIPYLSRLVKKHILCKSFAGIPIKKVTLYKYHPYYSDKLFKKPSTEYPKTLARQYALCFELGINPDKLTEKQKTKIQSFYMSGISFFRLSDYLNDAEYDEKAKNNEITDEEEVRIATLPEELDNTTWLLDDMYTYMFDNVYKNGSPGVDYRKKWFFFVWYRPEKEPSKDEKQESYDETLKLPHTKIPLSVRIEGPSETLFDETENNTTPRITINELHDIIWNVYLALKKKNSREPTSGEVFLELKRDYDKDYKTREYDKEEVIQEIEKGTIYWKDSKGNERKLKYSSFKTILCRIKKERKNSN
jgi:hypothetical protein